MPPSVYGARRPNSFATRPPATAPTGISPQPIMRYTLFTRPSSSGGTICWRRLTVTMFHIVTKYPLRVKNAPATIAEGASPTPIIAAANAASDMISDGIRPSRRVITGFVIPPTMAPIADAVQSNP